MAYSACRGELSGGRCAALVSGVVDACHTVGVSVRRHADGITASRCHVVLYAVRPWCQASAPPPLVDLLLDVHRGPMFV